MHPLLPKATCPHPSRVSSRLRGSSRRLPQRSSRRGGVDRVPTMRSARGAAGERPGVTIPVTRRPGGAGLREIRPGCPDGSKRRSLAAAALASGRVARIVRVGAGDRQGRLVLVLLAGFAGAGAVDRTGRRAAAVAPGLVATYSCWRCSARARQDPGGSDKAYAVKVTICAYITGAWRPGRQQAPLPGRVSAGKRAPRPGPVTQRQELLHRRVRTQVAALAGVNGDRVPVAAARHPVDRLDDGIHDQGADLAGEQVGVDVTQVAAIGRAEEVQLRVAQRLPQQVHVPGNIRREHVLHDRGVVTRQSGPILRSWR